MLRALTTALEHRAGARPGVARPKLVQRQKEFVRLLWPVLRILIATCSFGRSRLSIIGYSYSTIHVLMQGLLQQLPTFGGMALICTKLKEVGYLLFRINIITVLHSTS